MDEYFKYGAAEIAHLKNADPRMAEAVEKIGRIKRRVIPDLFEALVNCIVGQQISTKAHETIWLKMRGAVGRITPEIIAAMPPEEIKKFGISLRKVSYMKSAAQKILDRRFDIEALNGMDDGEVRARLCELDGVGAWTAEMLMIFSMLPAGRAQLRRLRPRARVADALRPQGNREKIVRKIPQALFPLLQRGEPIFVGNRGRGNHGAQRLCPA